MRPSRLPSRFGFSTKTTAWVLLGLGILCSGPLRAQTAQWQPDRGSLGSGQTSELQLVFEGCTPSSNPQPPAVPGLTLELAGTSQNIQTFNGSVSRRIIFNFLIRPSQRGTVRIPVFEVPTDKGIVRVGTAEFEVGEATVGQSGTSLDSIVQSRLQVPNRSVWAGEVFPISYVLTVARRYGAQLAGPIEWSAVPLTVEEWGKIETSEAMIGGEMRLLVTNRSRAVARSPGTITLQPAQQLVNLQTGTSMFGVFSRPTMEQYTITSPPSSLIVKPLPPNAPAGFNGAVGDFILTSKVVPTTATVGEPITWTLELTGTGNWTDISGLPSREVSRDFRIVQPQPKRTNKDNSLFEASFAEDVVLIPTRPGTFSIGPYQWSYFDPKAGTYKSVTSEQVSLTITAPAQIPISPTSSTVTEQSSRDGHPGSSPSARLGVQPPVLPSPIPGEPIPGSDAVMAPISLRAVAAWAAFSLPALVLLWVALALRRARLTDPHRSEREAHLRLRLTLKALQQTSDPKQRRALLRSWQRDTLRLLKIPDATASPRALTGASRLKDKECLAIWLSLWADVDRSLYSASACHPVGWEDRALAAIDGLPVPSFSIISLFTPRNLLPFVACITALVALTPLRGAAPLDLYREGRFREAQHAWSEHITQEPTDWIAHHNLALSLGQQDRWGESAAHASAAFLQQPSDPAVRRNWALSLDRAGYRPSEIYAFLAPNFLHRAAQRLSPAGWEICLIVSGWSLACGAGFLLCYSFGIGRSWIRPAAFVLGGLAILLGAASYAGVHSYGAAADHRAVMVWRTAVLHSIPTMADTTQKTTPLPAGTIAIVEKSFLKWHRLRFSNGQTGWVPSSDTIALWNLK